MLMSIDTRIRVIEHALRLLDKFNVEFRKALSEQTIQMTGDAQTLARKNAEEEGRLRRRLSQLRKESMNTDPPGIDNGLAKALGIALSDALPGFDLVEPDRDLTQGDKLRIAAVSQNCFRADLLAQSSVDLETATADLMQAVFALEFPKPGASEDVLYFNINYADSSEEVQCFEFSRSFEITRAT